MKSSFSTQAARIAPLKSPARLVRGSLISSGLTTSPRLAMRPWRAHGRLRLLARCRRSDRGTATQEAGSAAGAIEPWRRNACISSVRCACDPGPDGSGGDTVVDHIRLFPLIEGVRWTYRVHEQILPALKRAGVPLRWTDITVRHTGYADRALRSRKLERDSRILHEELAERPDDPFTLFNLGSVAIERAEWNDALGYLRRSLAGSAPSDSIVRKLFALIARAHQMQGDFRAALKSCAEGLCLDPEDAELWFRKAVVHRHNGEPEEAEECWRRILTLSRPQKFASVDQGIYGHLTRRNLAALAMERGDVEEARRQWRAVLEECPGDKEAIRHLRELGGVGGRIRVRVRGRIRFRVKTPITITITIRITIRSGNDEEGRFDGRFAGFVSRPNVAGTRRCAVARQTG